MLRDFDLIKHQFDGGIKVYPISDVHFGAIEHNKQAWESFVKNVADDPDAFLILNGDLVNNSIRTSVANPFDEIYRPREQKRRMVEYLKPIKDKILCLTSGNHERRSAKETDLDITYDIASKLDIEDLYRENIAFLKLSCGTRKAEANKANCSYIFTVTHGAGGGIYTGAAVNRNERFGNIIEGLDCLVVGHTHKGTVTRPSKIVVDPRNELITQKSYLVISSVSWMMYGGYAAQKMLLPSESCRPQTLILSDIKDKKNIKVIW